VAAGRPAGRGLRRLRREAGSHGEGRIPGWPEDPPTPLDHNANPGRPPGRRGDPALLPGPPRHPLQPTPPRSPRPGPSPPGLTSPDCRDVRPRRSPPPAAAPKPTTSPSGARCRPPRRRAPTWHTGDPTPLPVGEHGSAHLPRSRLATERSRPHLQARCRVPASPRAPSRAGQAPGSRAPARPAGHRPSPGARGTVSRPTRKRPSPRAPSWSRPCPPSRRGARCSRSRSWHGLARRRGRGTRAGGGFGISPVAGAPEVPSARAASRAARTGATPGRRSGS